jgi:nucleoside-diphosphate-sugar epimerase
MKIIVVGATGTIGSAIVKALEGRHEVIPASRKSGYRADIDDAASLSALFTTVGSFDAVVCPAGSASYKPFADLQPADFAVGFHSKFMGQVNLARLAIPHLVDGGSITLTSGV